MATFQFIAKDSAGQERRGTIEAGDRAGAIAAIRAQGLMPTALGEVKGGGGTPAPAKAAKKPAKAPAAAKPKKKGFGAMEIKLPSFLRGRVKAKDLTAFTRQLATLVNAGLPLMRC
ncbi:MAG: type II secretion system F family protein, partial [Kiritimatiellae bacterium]|nr:type II secretion system F family protein [Kiritimatiellia bacterium]